MEFNSGFKGLTLQYKQVWTHRKQPQNTDGLLFPTPYGPEERRVVTSHVARPTPAPITSFLSRPFYVSYNCTTHTRKEQFKQLQVFCWKLCRWHTMQIWQSAYNRYECKRKSGTVRTRFFLSFPTINHFLPYFINTWSTWSIAHKNEQ